jgi:hypothetical protein
MEGMTTFAAWLAGVPPSALIFAMLLSYALCFAGMTFAWLSYRKRHRNNEESEREK